MAEHLFSHDNPGFRDRWQPASATTPLDIKNACNVRQPAEN